MLLAELVAASLSLREVDAALTRISQVSGPGSKRRREDLLRELLARATADAQPFLAALLVGELRQGSLAGLMVDALAEATGVAAGALRRALMVSGDLPAVARAVLEDGEAALADFRVEIFRPLQPMLAQTAGSPEEAVETLGEPILDWRMDGARVQVHKEGERVRVYSRRLREVTRAVPEVVEAVAALDADSVILDGEVLAPALRPDPGLSQGQERRRGGYLRDGPRHLRAAIEHARRRGASLSRAPFVTPSSQSGVPISRML